MRADFFGNECRQIRGSGSEHCLLDLRLEKLYVCGQFRTEFAIIEYYIGVAQALGRITERRCMYLTPFQPRIVPRRMLIAMP